MQKEVVEESVTCSDCGSDNFIYDSVGITCRNCGVIQAEKEAASGFEGELKSFDPDEIQNRDRVGPPETYILASKFLPTNFDPTEIRNFRKLTPEQKIELYKLKRAQKKNIGIVKTLDGKRKGVNELTKIVEKLKNVPRTTHELAGYYLHKAIDHGLSSGTMLGPLAVASLYKAFRKHGIPIMMEDLSEKSGFETKLIFKAYSRLIKLDPDFKPDPKVYDTSAYTSRVIYHKDVKGIPAKVKIRAQKLIQLYEKNLGESQSKDPKATEATALYMVVRAEDVKSAKYTEKNAAEIANVSEVTIRNRYDDLIDVIGPALFDFFNPEETKRLLKNHRKYKSPEKKSWFKL